MYLGVMDAESRFTPGERYSRFDVMRALGLEPKMGGNWFTGYNRHGDEWFLFPSVGDAGRTGHSYANRWIGDQLEWYTKKNHPLSYPSVQALVSPGAVVHLFTRNDNRDSFEYHGLVEPAEKFDEPTARIIWRVRDRTPWQVMPDELGSGATVVEGTKLQVLVTVHERDRTARRRCLAHWGYRCQVCAMSFAERYGDLGQSFIHVHHLAPLSSKSGQYELDPIADLRPVCPNCHAMLHVRTPPFSIEELRDTVERQARLPIKGTSAKPASP